MLSIPQNMKIQKGFTLVELMITLTVIIILAIASAPALRSFLQNNKAVTETNQLVSAMNFGRSEAVKRRTPVVICALNAAQDDCTTGTDPWNTNGWMVFADRNNDGAYTNNGDATLAAGEDLLLKQWKEIKNKQDINITSVTTKLTYLQTGALSATADVGIKVSVDDAVDPDGADRCVRVLPTGRVEYEKMQDEVTCP